MLVNSPFPSPGVPIIPDLPGAQADAAPAAPTGIGSPIVVPLNTGSDHTEEWILGPWPPSGSSHHQGLDEIYTGTFDRPHHHHPHQQPQQGQARMARPATHQRTTSASQGGYPQVPGGWPPQQAPQAPHSAYLGYGALPNGPMASPHLGPGGMPGQHQPFPSPYVYAQPIPGTPYMAPGMGQNMGPMYGGMPPSANEYSEFAQPQSNRLARPKEEAQTSISHWENGPHYSVLLDKDQVDIFRPQIMLHPLLASIPDPPTDAVYLVNNLLLPTSAIYTSDDDPRRSWRKGRDDPATFPRITFMKIVSPYFPWTISVENLEGVTVNDIFERVYTSMQQMIGNAEWETTPKERRDKIGKWYRYNRSTKGIRGGTLPRGVCRVDWLGESTLWSGLVKDDAYVTKRFGITQPATFVMTLRSSIPQNAEDTP